MTAIDQPMYSKVTATVRYPECWWAVRIVACPWRMSSPMTSCETIRMAARRPVISRSGFIVGQDPSE